MALLDIVDDNDNTIGQEDFITVHEQGLRHRSVQLLVFEYPDYRRARSRLLVAERSREQETSPLKLHVPAGGHVRVGETYLDAALRQYREELFHDREDLPDGVIVYEVERYKNDSRSTNKENTCLFMTRHSGPFSPDPAEISRVYWQEPETVYKDMKQTPQNYTSTFVNALKHYLWQQYSD
jgi:isopentenyldiphosphate isomerase